MTLQELQALARKLTNNEESDEDFLSEVQDVLQGLADLEIPSSADTVPSDVRLQMLELSTHYRAAGEIAARAVMEIKDGNGNEIGLDIRTKQQHFYQQAVYSIAVAIGDSQRADAHTRKFGQA